jgi:ribonuclease-3
MSKKKDVPKPELAKSTGTKKANRSPKVDRRKTPAIKFTAEQLNVISACEEKLGYQFSNKSILFEALTHASFAEKRINSYERMEFLGDSILGFVVCEYLFQQFPSWNEGDLTKVKSIVVSRQTCSIIGAELGLADYLSVGKGIGSKGTVPRSLLANVFEATIAAMYLDGGLRVVRKFLKPIVKKHVVTAVGGGLEVNYKSELQQYSQKRFGVPPAYLVLGSSGPDHEKQFQIAAQVLKRVFAPAWGKNKKEAEQRAAANALAIIAGRDAPFTGATTLENLGNG